MKVCCLRVHWICCHVSFGCVFCSLRLVSPGLGCLAALWVGLCRWLFGRSYFEPRICIFVQGRCRCLLIYCHYSVCLFRVSVGYPNSHIDCYNCFRNNCFRRCSGWYCLVSYRLHASFRLVFCCIVIWLMIRRSFCVREIRNGNAHFWSLGLLIFILFGVVGFRLLSIFVCFMTCSSCATCPGRYWTDWPTCGHNNSALGHSYKQLNSAYQNWPYHSPTSNVTA